MPRPPEIRIAHDSHTWAAAAAEIVHTIGQEAVRTNGRFLIALSGGTTPEALYQTITSPGFSGRFDWSRTIFFFSDERGVPPDDPRSNYASANRALFTPLNITPSQVYRMAGESRDPQAAAHEYEQQLRRATNTPPSSLPILDLVLLGLGEDGHTASLFPESPILRDDLSLIAVSQSPKDPPIRLTMTLGVINRASVIL
ncbi:MAG TPA: 6-phosphogluconolactonase, partial [Nitrospiraceae bacterium]|nr:6-phosphogluconolactonase [Nitrospiraceae bacterium]